MAVIHIVSPVQSKRPVVSSMERAGSGCHTFSVASIEKATVPVVFGTCPAWSGPAVLVINVASRVWSKRLYQYYWERVQYGAGRQCLLYMLCLQ